MDEHIPLSNADADTFSEDLRAAAHNIVDEHTPLNTSQQDRTNISLTGDKPVNFSLEDIIVKASKDRNPSVYAANTLAGTLRELQHQAEVDELTGIYNKKGFSRILESELETANEGDFAIFMIDLSNFKKLNDTKGHLFGDEVLVRVADILKSKTRQGDDEQNRDILMRKTDTARVGGDEFVLLVRLQSREDAASEYKHLSPQQRLEITDNKLRKAFHDELMNDELHSLGFNVAMGAALYRDGMTAEEIYEMADQNMFKNKHEQHETNGKYR